MEEKARSLRPDDMSAGGGGILADTNLRMDKVRFGMETYKGKANPAPALMVDYTDLDTGEEFQQSWSVGNASDFTPSKDGKQIISTKDIKQNSNFGIFMTELSTALGADVFNEHIDSDISVLEGMECHVIQKPDDRPTAKPRKDTNTGREYPATIPVVDHVLVAPWDKKSGAASAAASADSGELKTQAVPVIKAVLAANTDGLDIANLAVEVFRAATSNQPALVELINNDEAFVSGIDGVVKDGEKFKLG